MMPVPAIPAPRSAYGFTVGQSYRYIARNPIAGDFEEVGTILAIKLIGTCVYLDLEFPNGLRALTPVGLVSE